MDIGTPNTSASLPQDQPVVQTFNHVKKAFPSETSSLTVVIKAKDVTAPAVKAGLAKFEHAVAQHPEQLPSRPDGNRRQPGQDGRDR